MEEKKRILKKINNECFGGSENQLRQLVKNLSNEDFKDINLILNDTDPKLIEKNKINVLWMQHFVNQKEVKNFGSADYISQLDCIVFNSNWNFEKYVYQFKIPESKSIVIRNAIDKIKLNDKPKDKINLIYHTTPWRGLVHLLNVFKKLNLENVELSICSSTEIYGKEFSDIYGPKYEKLFNDCKKIKNVKYLGFVKNDQIIEILKNTHIYSYPCVWPETSCISAIEAMAAGCQIVSTNLGALYETCSPFATFVGFDRNFNNLEARYLETLEKSIKNFWSKENIEKLKIQHQAINKLYSWELRSNEWKELFKKLKNSTVF